MAVLYTGQGPFYGVPFKLTADLRNADGGLVTLASSDSEVSKDGGSFSDCTNEASEITTGLVTLDLTATEMTCNAAIVQIKGTNHVTYTVHLAPKHDVMFIGTASAYSGGVITLNTTDQVGSASDGQYDGCFVQVIGGTGAGQAGRFASTDTTYNGTSKQLTLVQAFNTVIDNTSIVMIGNQYVETVTQLSSTALGNLEDDYDGTGYAKTNSTIGTCTTNTDMRGTDNALASGDEPIDANITQVDGTTVTGSGTEGDPWGP